MSKPVQSLKPKLPLGTDLFKRPARVLLGKAKLSPANGIEQLMVPGGGLWVSRAHAD